MPQNTLLENPAWYINGPVATRPDALSQPKRAGAGNEKDPPGCPGGSSLLRRRRDLNPRWGCSPKPA